MLQYAIKRILRQQQKRRWYEKDVTYTHMIITRAFSRKLLREKLKNSRKKVSGECQVDTKLLKQIVHILLKAGFNEAGYSGHFLQ